MEGKTLCEYHWYRLKNKRELEAEQRAMGLAVTAVGTMGGGMGGHAMPSGHHYGFTNGPAGMPYGGVAGSDMRGGREGGEEAAVPALLEAAGMGQPFSLVAAVAAAAGTQTVNVRSVYGPIEACALSTIQSKQTLCLPSTRSAHFVCGLAFNTL
eukprot:8948854-Pyramimonas_sp.AAC.1